MDKVKVYNLEGNVIKDISLNEKIFNIPVNEGLVHQVYVAQMANKRQPLAHTKERGEVRGGGKKPWRQKGTGRARAGTIRSPLWVGGGITFGPRKTRNFSKKINKKMKNKALLMVLSDKALEKNIIITENFKLEKIKTKDFTNILDKLPIEKKVLIVLPKSDEVVWKSSNNLQNVKVILADSLNMIDILNFNTLVIPEESLEIIEATYLK